VLNNSNILKQYTVYISKVCENQNLNQLSLHTYTNTHICIPKNTITLTVPSTHWTVFYIAPPEITHIATNFEYPVKEGKLPLRKCSTKLGWNIYCFEINISLILMILKPYNFYTRHTVLFNYMYTRKAM
jgi:hypothetical protein